MSIIDKPSDYFNTKLYTGTGATNSITGVGFQPDWTWIKKRNGAVGHRLYDAVRGATNTLYSSDSAVEATGQTTTLTSFNSDGFTVVSESGVNASSDTYASWNWKAGTAFSNSAGENGADLASTGSYNRDAGFSIVTFTGNATDDQQIYHGLNAVPQMMILKNRTNVNAENWQVYHQAIGNTHALSLNTTAAKNDNDEFWSDETPTSTVFTVGRQDATNGNGNTHVVYCFAEKQGYSKFGSYTGNGNADGTFVYTGFKPAFVICKRTNGTAHWIMNDTKRLGYNPCMRLYPNLSNAEETSSGEMDLVSNGFKCRNTNNNMNGSGDTYIYMAFAENPFVTSTGVPATAR
jgi:hypothetical protein